MEIAIKILEGEIARREQGNKIVPNHLRLKESLEEIESLTKAVVELKNLSKATVIKSVCDVCGSKSFVYSKKQKKGICLDCWENEQIVL